MSTDRPTGPYGAPEPEEEWFIERGWILRDGVRRKPSGEPVFFADVIAAYAPLRRWVHKKTKCWRSGSCRTTPKGGAL